MAETLEEFARRTNLLRLGKADQVRHLAWFLHSVDGKDRVVTGDLRDCYHQLHLEPPNISQYLGYLSDGRSRSFIRDKRGFRLEGTWRARLNDTLADHSSLIAVRALLSDLVPKLSDSAERSFLEEALRCYGVKAFRATVVMVWNLAYSHLRFVIVSDKARLASFNEGITRKYPKKTLSVQTEEDFDELKEFEVVEIAYSSRIISKNVAEIMRDKLKRRNMAAHPSSVEITQAQADDVVTDLVNNVVLKIA